ncbi:MAG: hypothetical protein K5897_10185 [Eubacterium sp.]|nr:hypothetical protein [Eubacterium sp.]
MTVATIIALGIGLVLIVVSFLLTGKDEKTEEEAAVERTTPGLREELTEADKKQLKKLTDTYIKEYGKKQVKDLTKTAIETEVKAAVSEKQPVIEVKIADKMNTIDQKLAKVDQKLAEIDARSEAGVKAVSNQASAISAGWAQNRQEVQTVFEQIVDKEKEVKIQLGLIDEYKKGLEKLKEEADLSVTRLHELQLVEVSGRYARTDEESEEAALEDEAEESEETAAVAADEAVESEEETAEAVDEAEESEEAEAADEAEESEEAETEAEAEEYEESEAEEEAEEYEEAEAEEEAEEYEEAEAEEEAEEYEEAEAEEETEEYEEAEVEDEEYAEDEDEAEDESSNIVAFPQDSGADQKAIEEAVRDTLVRKARRDRKGQQNDSDEDFDEDFDDEFDDDEDDLKAITNLDQILDREGIDLAAEDPTVNILTMYGAGLSIIEISKVLKMGVGEVKYIIDSNTKNQ